MGNIKMNESFNLESLDQVFKRMVNTIHQSKDDIFVISAQTKENYEQIKRELDDVKREITVLIKENDFLFERTKKARLHLMKVSKNFDIYSEREIKDAYEAAHNYQMAHSVNEVQEKQLRTKRDDLERRLEGLFDTIERADQLANQVSVIIAYLTSDLKNVGEALADAKYKQDFAIRIIEAQEDERRRVSREIHDGPAQMLAHILLRSGLLEKIYKEEGKEAAKNELEHLKESIRSTLIEVRRVIFDLRPMNLDDLGVSAALNKYLDEINEMEKDVIIEFKERGYHKRLDTNYEIAVFRIVQESVTNAIKHGEPRTVSVQLEWLQDKLNIVVKDDGRGFDVHQVKEKSFGLIGMRERVDLLKGTFNVQSKIGKGTVNLIQIPFREEL